MKSTSSSRIGPPWLVTPPRSGSGPLCDEHRRDSSGASEPVTGLAERAFAEGEDLLGSDAEHERFATEPGSTAARFGAAPQRAVDDVVLPLTVPLSGPRV